MPIYENPRLQSSLAEEKMRKSPPKKQLKKIETRYFVEPPEVIGKVSKILQSPKKRNKMPLDLSICMETFLNYDRFDQVNRNTKSISSEK